MKNGQIFVCFCTIFINIQKLDAYRVYSFKDHVAIFPCEGTGSIVEDFKRHQPPEDENKYELCIDTDRSKGLPVNSTLQMKFDSFANISLNHDIGRIENLPSVGKYFTVLMISNTEHYGFINMTVRGRQGRPVPNILIAVLNHVNLCPDGFSTGHWDKYIVSDLPNCGRRQNRQGGLRRRKRVTHGTVARDGDWPWHVAIFRTSSPSKLDTKYICGGCLISRSRVLTAGHCVTQMDNITLPQQLLVKLGIYELVGGDDNTLQQKTVDQVIRHPYFSQRNIENNIAMLVLSSDVLYGQTVQPICLWQKERTSKSTITDKIGHVAGWGFNENRVSTNRLNQATMIVVSDETCLRSDAFYVNFLREATYCAGYRNGTSVCNGDSGGEMIFPEITSSDGVETWYLRGIISISKATQDNICDSNQFVIFTDTAFFLDWIEQNMK